MEDSVAKVKEVRRHLPYDLIADHILTRLPIKPVLQFKCVSKQWYSTISSYQFARLYHKLSLFSRSPSPTQYLFIRHGNNHYVLTHDDDDDDIGTPTFDVNKKLFEFRNNFHVQDNKLVLIGSCNGLVCFASSCGHFFILWNPITGIFQKYSDPEVPFDFSRTFRASWGFGYVSKVDDFKVIRILNLPGTVEIRVHVFSLKSNKWTRIADELYQDVLSFCPCLKTCRLCSQPFFFNNYFEILISNQGVLVNETLYWIVSKLEDRDIIVGFDLVSEVFDANIGLNLVYTDESEDLFICNMGGCVSKFRHNMDVNPSIHMLKGPGKVESIYLSKKSKDFPVAWCKDMVGFTRTDKFFIQLRDSVVGIVDPNSEPMKFTLLATFRSLGTTLSRRRMLASFVPSLTFPYAVEECSGKHNA